MEQVIVITGASCGIGTAAHRTGSFLYLAGGK
jgi:NADP-dependent 3-hydroxy acid dehydrogenase YdfG